MHDHSPNDRVLNDLTFREEPPARETTEVKRRHSCNRAAWNEVAVHAYRKNLDQTIADLKSGKSNMHPVEKRNLGDLRTWCNTAIHLQCASGQDTLSLWLEGADRVVGIDISEEHIANAQATSDALGIEATWYACDVLDAPAELDGTADLVYTGRGSMCWLHDLDAWAAVVNRLLKPGGVFHVLDDHPFVWLFDPDADKPVYFDIDYFAHAESSQGWPGSYVGNFIPMEQQARKYERLWTLSAIVNAVANAGLRIEYLGEHAEDYWPSFPNLKNEYRGKIPLTFSLKARK
ncbi:MAG: class I SAM-dependent methyltransferase [Candidatus Zixiibacteriota bacterium]